MTVGLAILLAVFGALLTMNVPVAFVLGIATVLAAFALGYENVLMAMAGDMGSGVDAFALLAIPFFILAGDLMGAGGLAGRLIDLASVLLGRFRWACHGKHAHLHALRSDLGIRCSRRFLNWRHHDP